MFLTLLFFATQTVSAAPTIDYCPNIAGMQTTVPAKFQIVEEFCVSAEDAVIVQAPTELAPTPLPAAAAPKPAKKPKVELRASPRIVQSSPFGQQRVLLTLVITNADEQHWCPEITWEWPNGTASVEEGDCPPFDQATPEDLAKKSFSRLVPIILPPGPSTLRVVLRKPGKTVSVAEVSVRVPE